MALRYVESESKPRPGEKRQPGERVRPWGTDSDCANDHVTALPPFTGSPIQGTFRGTLGDESAPPVTFASLPQNSGFMRFIHKESVLSPETGVVFHK